MKKFSVILVLSVAFYGCYNRIGDLTVVSNRNFDTKTEYQLITREAVGKAKSKKGDVLENAIDNAVEKYNGEHLRNVKIYVKANGKKVKVIGDVWGFPKINTDTINVKSNILVGDKVVFKRFGKLTEGTVMGFNKTMLIVKLPNEQLMEIKATEVTRIEK